MNTYNDDLIMALGIGMFVRNTTMRIHSSSTTMSKSILNSLNYSQNEYSVGYAQNEGAYVPDYFKMNVSNRDEEDLRWLVN